MVNNPLTPWNGLVMICMHDAWMQQTQINSHKSHNFWLKACMESDQVSFPRVFLWIRRFQQRVLPSDSKLSAPSKAPSNMVHAYHAMILLEETYLSCSIG